VVNSRDAMPRGGRIAIETTASDVHAGGAIEPGSYVVLRVEDSGTGMTPDVAARVFEPFFTTKDKGKGTGLGLSMVFGIVKQSGGHIALDSRPGVGTTFTIYLPRTERAIEPAQPLLPASERTGTETVLLVEDDDQVRTLSAAILRRHGYTVLDAENAGEALLISDKHDGPIHLLLTDVVMPRMSGRDLAERLVAQRPNLRVLFVSGYSEELIADHGVLASGLALLQKPITPDGLLHKIREVLDSP
jgi:CheY-like chemotaxis protein